MQRSIVKYDDNDGDCYIIGFLLGSIHASVSCAVVMPSVIRLGASCGSGRNWAQLVCTAGGTDTALSVGVYGLFFSFMFHAESDVYKYVKVTFVEVARLVSLHL